MPLYVINCRCQATRETLWKMDDASKSSIANEKKDVSQLAE
jgi:hypothetical protein